MSTLNDVAKEAGVSAITVSRVINTPEKVKQKTRDQVLLAMEKVHYVQNPVAKALVSKRVGIIDVYVPETIDLSNPFVMHLIGGISEGLSRRMYSFLLIRNRLREHQCDGYIATGLLKDETGEMYRYAKERSRPLALFGHSGRTDIDCIDVDNVEGIRRITEYVMHKGHRALAMVNADEDKDYPQDRYEGYCRALEAEGNDACKTVFYTGNCVQGGYKAMQEILKESRHPSAVICATDDIAIGVIRAAADHGYRVPEDISVTGYDGLGHHLLSTPKITTMQQPVYEIGKLLADTLVRRIEGEEGYVRKALVPDLIEEHSVAAYTG